MKNKNFDKIIQEKLENQQIPFQAEHWDLFEKRFDGVGTPTPEDKEVDRLVYDKLHNLEAPYQANSWKVLLERLNEETLVTRRILRYKTSELLVALLLLFVFNQFIWTEKNQEPIIAEKSALNSDKKSLEKNANTNASLSDESESKNNNPASVAGESINNAGVSLYSETSESLESKSPSNQNFYIQNNQVQLGTLLEESQAYWLAMGNLPKLKRVWSSLERSTLDNGLFESLTPGIVQEDFKVLEPIDFIPGQYPELLEYKRTHQFPELDPKKKKFFIRVGMFTALNYDQITTHDQSIDLKDRSRYDLGYSGGLSASLGFKRWELETGLIYTSKQYSPPNVRFISGGFRLGYLEKELTNIELNIVNIPLNVRYNLVQHKNWRVYALAGLSLQVALQANYYRAVLQVPQQSPPGGENFTQLDDKNFDDGWFEGGPLDKNSFISGNVGFGLERYISTRWSVFAQPTYLQSLKYFSQGYGPYQDRFNTFSIYAGVKVKL